MTVTFFDEFGDGFIQFIVPKRIQPLACLKIRVSCSSYRSQLPRRWMRLHRAYAN